MSTLTAPPFPLPPGHMFGPRTGDLRFHQGQGNVGELQGLIRWQERYRERLNRKFTPSGRWDAATQAAVIDVQTITGLPVTGVMCAATYGAVWAAERPKKPPIVRGPLPRPGKKTWHYWRKYSKRDVEYGSDPSAPAWFPGRPFGVHERGWHVQQLQERLGVKPTGTFNEVTVQRVRGLQRAWGLPVSGVVDVRFATRLDPGVG